jgi:penicillin-binding protein 2
MRWTCLLVAVIIPSVRKLLALLLLLTACAGTPGIKVLPAPTGTPVPGGADLVASAFLSAWERGDLQGMYSLLSPTSQALIERSAFIARYETFAEEGGVTAVRPQVHSALQDGDRATVAYDVTYEVIVLGEIGPKTMTMPLVHDGGRWGVTWSDGLIMPELAGGNHLRLDVRAPARANLYDRNGRVLAADETAVSIAVVPRDVTDLATVVATVSPLVGKSYADLQAKIEAAAPDWLVPLGVVTKAAAEANYEALAGLPGVQLRESFVRGYRPVEGPVAPHVAGMVGPIPEDQLDAFRAEGYSGDEQVGITGLEAWGEPYLAGTRGATLVVLTPQGQVSATLATREPEPARNVYSALDHDLQIAAQNLLQGYRGAIVVMDVHTGEVLALASSPAFDPNVLVQPGVDAQVLNALLGDPARPMLNRASQGTYPLGSVFKVVVMAAALEAGGYTPQTPYTCTGVWTGLGPNWVKGDWKPGGHGTISLHEALVGSCDPYFYEIGLNLDRINPQIMPSYGAQFGFGAKLGAEGIAEDGGLMPDPAWKRDNLGEGWTPGDSVNLSIGQGFLLVTPLQTVDMLAAVANGGTRLKPLLVHHVAAPGGASEDFVRPQVLGSLPVSAEHLAAVQDALRGVTSEEGGTARHRFTGLSIPVAGKTGTAENAGEEPHAWFAGYAPADDPQIAIVVLVENSGEGSEYAAPMFRRLVEVYYKLPQAPLPWQTPTPTPTPSP